MCLVKEISLYWGVFTLIFILRSGRILYQICPVLGFFTWEIFNYWFYFCLICFLDFDLTLLSSINRFTFFRLDYNIFMYILVIFRISLMPVEISPISSLTLVTWIFCVFVLISFLKVVSLVHGLFVFLKKHSFHWFCIIFCLYFTNFSLELDFSSPFTRFLRTLLYHLFIFSWTLNLCFCN